MPGDETLHESSPAGDGIPAPAKVAAPVKGKSCKGCLYYSSVRKSNRKTPICFGVGRTLPQVPGYIVGESELEAAKDGRNLSDFRYACVGYSVFADKKVDPKGKKEKPTELPFCVGIELLLDKRATDAAHVPAPAHAHARSKEDVVRPQPSGLRPTQSSGKEFLNRFTRNAGLVAAGVNRNLHRVGNYIKDNLADITYPYRRPPK